MTLAQYEINDPTFVTDLKESERYVWLAAKWLSGMGYNVTVRAVNVRPDVDQMAEYADTGDIEIIQRVEVKHRPTLNFHGLEEFPYPSIIVDVCHTFDKAAPKPFAYLIFNADATGCIVVKSDTRKYWAKVEKYDKAKKRKRNFYECPLEYCKFWSV